MFVYLFNWMLISLEFMTLLVNMTCTCMESLWNQIVPKPKKNVANQVVLITGAGCGLGRELALRFTKLGAILVLWDINKEKCDRTSKEIHALGGKSYSYEVDVGDFSQVATTAERVRDEVGVVDMLINNAAILKVAPLTDMTPADIKRTLNVNLCSHFWTVKCFLPDMMAQNSGHIVAISSNLGLVGKSHFTDYAASKFGVHGLMLSLQEEMNQFRKRNIFTTIVCPAAISSGLCRTIDTRFPRCFPLLEPGEAAKEIITGILQNQTLLLMPSGYKLLYFFLNNAPHKISLLVSDFLGNTTEID